MMNIHTITESIAWNARMALVAVGMLLAMPLILIGYIVVRVSEERDLRVLAADAGMSVEEYLDAEHQRVANYVERRHGNV